MSHLPYPGSRKVEPRLRRKYTEAFAACLRIREVDPVTKKVKAIHVIKSRKVRRLELKLRKYDRRQLHAARRVAAQVVPPDNATEVTVTP